jgi:hypothetical protein
MPCLISNLLLVLQVVMAVAAAVEHWCMGQAS